ncbi:hypothetical protein SpCBS45565_g02686 [Spizellomyces sp. 'palustris']|nr:hypothetical protein SpCBS45565_g02686 [Spizellomyces sp. 'palustris']
MRFGLVDDDFYAVKPGDYGGIQSESPKKSLLGDSVNIRDASPEPPRRVFNNGSTRKPSMLEEVTTPERIDSSLDWEQLESSFSPGNSPSKRASQQNQQTNGNTGELREIARAYERFLYDYKRQQRSPLSAENQLKFLAESERASQESMNEYYRRKLEVEGPWVSDTQKELQQLCQHYKRIADEKVSEAQKKIQELRREFHEANLREQHSIEAALRKIEEIERREALQRQEEERRRAEKAKEEEAQRKAAEAKAQAAKEQEAKDKAAREQEAKDRVAREEAAKQRAAHEQAVKAQAAEEKQAQREAKAAQAKSWPDKLFDTAQARLAIIHIIKKQIKPQMGTNPALMQSIFRTKMTITQKIGQIMSSEKKVIEIGRALDTVLKNAKSASQEEYAICMDLLAKSVVKQAESEIAVKTDSAFPLAVLCIMIYRQHTEFLDVLLGRFVKRCPYIVPLYPPRFESDTDDDFRKRLGYREIDDDVWEDEIQYTERMCGLMAIYAAIVQTTIIPNDYGLQNGLNWLFLILSIEPRRISPFLILRFLEIAGHELLNQYRPQTEEALMFLRNEFIPKIPAKAIAGTTRLQIFLDSVFEKGAIPPPEGRTLGK